MSTHPDTGRKKSSGGKIVMLSLLFLLLVMSYCSYSVYRGFADFPDWAKKEVVYEQHGNLIKAIEAEINAASSLYDLAARLEKTSYADQILYMEIEHVPGKDEETGDPFEEEEELVVIGDKGSSSQSYFLQDDVGYGTRNGINTIVIKLDVEHLPEANHVLFHLTSKEQVL